MEYLQMCSALRIEISCLKTGYRIRRSGVTYSDISVFMFLIDYILNESLMCLITC